MKNARRVPGVCVPPGLSPGCSASPERSLPERWQPVWRQGQRARSKTRRERPVSPRRTWRPASSPQAFSQPAWRQVSPRAWRRSQRPAWLPASRRAWLRQVSQQASPQPWLPAWPPVSRRPSQPAWRRAWLPAWRPRSSLQVFRRGFRRRLGGGLGCRFSCRLGRCGFRRGLGSRFRRRLGRCLRRRLDADAGEFLDLPGQRIDLAVQLLHLVAARHAETRDGAVQALVESFLELAPLAERTVPNLVDLALRRAGGSLRRTDLRVHIGLRFFFSLLAVFHQGLEQLAAVLADLRVGPQTSQPDLPRVFLDLADPTGLFSLFFLPAILLSLLGSRDTLEHCAQLIQLSRECFDIVPGRYAYPVQRASDTAVECLLDPVELVFDFSFTEERPVLTLSLAEST